MTEHRFEIDDQAYWTDPWIDRKALQRPLMQRGEEALLIGAPSTMALDQHRSLPIAVLRVAKAEDGAAPDFHRSAIVVAVDVDTDEAFARLAFDARAPLPARARPGNGSKGDSFSGDATAMLSEGHTIDLIARLKLPLSRSSYGVGIVCQDRQSNTCRTTIVDSAGHRDPAVEAFLNDARAADRPPRRISPEPGAVLPSYRRLAPSPSLPAAPGVAMLVARVTAINDGECLLYGSFRLPAPPRHRVDPAPDTAAETSATADRVSAILPITLLLTGSVDAAPLLLRLDVPSYRPLEGGDEQAMATGHFALDLCSMAPLTARPQTWFIYALAGGAIGGPVLAAFVRKPTHSFGSRYSASAQRDAR